ncbi:Flp pilus assembly protein CpaB [Pseudomonas putida]
MKKNSLLLLVTAVLLAAGVALLVRTLLAPRVAPPPVAAVVAEAPAVYVLVAAEAINPGDFINASQLTWKQAKGNADRSQFFIRDKDHEDSLYGATLRTTVDAGQALPRNQVVHRGEPGFLAAVLSPDMRAVSVPTSRLESSFGLVSAGDRVDVILSLERSKKDNNGTPGQSSDAPFLASQTLLRDVRVLALNNVTGPEASADTVDPKARDKAAKFPYTLETVTLEVNPQQAEKLAVAKEVGSLQLALRPLRAAADELADDAIPGPVTHLDEATDVYAARPAAAKVVAKVVAMRGNKVEVLTPSEQ